MWHLYPLTCTCIHSLALVSTPSHLHLYPLICTHLLSCTALSSSCPCPHVFVLAHLCLFMPASVRCPHAFGFDTFTPILMNPTHSRSSRSHPLALLIHVHQHSLFASINTPRSRLLMLLVRVYQCSSFASMNAPCSRPPTLFVRVHQHTLHSHPSTLFVGIHQRSSFGSINAPRSRPSTLLIHVHRHSSFTVEPAIIECEAAVAAIGATDAAGGVDIPVGAVTFKVCPEVIAILILFFLHNSRRSSHFFSISVNECLGFLFGQLRLLDKLIVCEL